jgi:peptidyl-prolyl cis-trans isomerase D
MQVFLWFKFFLLMAIITKIQEKSGIAVVFIAVSLILFIVGSDLFTGNSSLFGGSDNTNIGEISGQKILQADFAAELATQTQNFQQNSQRAPSEQELQQIRGSVWERMINDIAFQKEYDELGVKVSDEELTDMVQGKNIHPSIRQQFTNPQTGIFDKNNVVSFLKGLKTQPLANQQQWADFEKGLVINRVREKYNNLLTLSTNTNSLEAKVEYEAQTAKTNAKYLFVPYSSIVDSTIAVKDSQLEDYLAAHKDLFEGYESRTMEYVAFPVIATKADTASFYDKLKDIAKGLGSASNADSYATSMSENRTAPSVSLAEVPASVKANLGTFNVGGVYGPFKDGDLYTVLKYNGVETDSLYTIRASHILFQPRAKTDSAKAEARKQALTVLGLLKGGADFGQLAQQYGSDGTAQKGGDLGYFKNNGSMVKPFESAIFGFGGSGLMPNLVETDFGYHIVKITEAKSNQKYKLSMVSKALAPSEQTKNSLYSKAQAFSSEVSNLDAFKARVKKDKLISFTANRIMEGSASINGMPNAKAIVQWAFDSKTDKGDVSAPFEQESSYIVGIVTGASSKDKPSVDDFRDELKYRVLAEIKATKISDKLKALPKATLEAMAAKYGAGAIVETTEGITLSGGALKSAGADPAAIGKAFGLKAGQKSGVVKGDNGMYIMEGTGITAAPAIADYGQYKTQLQSGRKGAASYLGSEAIKQGAKIVNNIAKFY